MTNYSGIQLKYIAKFPFLLLLVFFLLNAFLIWKIYLSIELNYTHIILIIVSTTITSAYFWSQYQGSHPKRGLLVIGLMILGISVLSMLIIILPNQGLLTRYIKLGVIAVGAILLIPFCYYFVWVLMPKQNNVLGTSTSKILPFWITHIFITPYKFVLWGIISTVFLSFLIIPTFIRSDIIGWDTPTYMFRARLLEHYGINLHSLIGGGYQIAFPYLSVFFHKLTGWNYVDIVRLLPPFILLLIGIASGYLTYLTIKSQSLAILSALCVLAWGLSPNLVSDARDNVIVALFGILAIICLIKSQMDKNYIWKVLQVVFLILSGISHLALSIIYFLVIFHVNLTEIYEKYWLGKRKNLLLHLWKAIWIPLFSGLVVGLIWYSELPAFFNSLGIGLRTMTELSGERDETMIWIFKHYNLGPSLPLIVFGLAVVTWYTFKDQTSKQFKVIFIWSFTSIYLGIMLLPISFLSGRFLMMTPQYLLIPIGIYQIGKTIQSWSTVQRKFGELTIILFFIGILFPYNLLANTKMLYQGLPGVSKSDYSYLEYVNYYIKANHADPPYIFLALDTTIHHAAFSDLWMRTIRAGMADEALLDTYLYFGELENLLNKEPTYSFSTVPDYLESKNELDRSSQKWFAIISENGILDKQEMTIFIIKSFNNDTFDNYLFDSRVNIIGPNILAVDITSSDTK
jgi:hypothetical protein